MGLQLVLENFDLDLTAGGGQRFHYQAGDLIEDGVAPVVGSPVEPVALLVPQGLAVLPYVAGTMAAPLATFLEAHGRDEPRPSIVTELLLAGALDLLPPLTGIVNPNGVTTGSLGQRYYDSVGGVWYSCDSVPTGTSWEVL